MLGGETVSLKLCTSLKSGNRFTGNIVRLLVIMMLVGLGIATGIAQSRAAELHDWSGAYLGVFAGTGNAHSVVTGNRFTYDRNRAINRVDHQYTGNTYGGLLGYNFQQGNFVAGLELEFAGTTFDSHMVFNSDNDIDNVELNWYGVVGGRAGVAFDKTLVYAKGGLAFGEFYNIGGDMDASGFDLEDAHIKEDVIFGYAIGGGLEHAISDRLSFRVEFMRMDFDDYIQANADNAVPQQQYLIDNGVVETWKFAVSFKF